MKKFLLPILIYLLHLGPTYSQPGAFGGHLEFKIYTAKNKTISPQDTDYKVTVENTQPGDTFLYYQDHYRAIPEPTPVGSYVSKDFRIVISHNADTMIVYPPNFGEKTILLDSIPFSAGTYNIPDYIYHFEKETKFKPGPTTPNISGDWNIFKQNSPTLYLDLETVYEKPKDWDVFSSKYFKKYPKPIKINNSPKASYYLNNILLINDSQNTYKTYLIREITDTVFQENVYSFKTDTIFYEDGSYHAIGFRDFGCGGNYQTVYGKFKLRFDTDLSAKDKECLEYKFHKEFQEYANRDLKLGENTEIMIQAINRLFNAYEQKHSNCK